MAAKPAPKTPAKKTAPAAPAAPAPKTEKAPKAPKPPKEEKPKVVREKGVNGLSRPLPGSTTGVVWDIADRLSTRDKNGAITIPAPRAAVLAEAKEKHGTKDATGASQYQSWKAFHGIKGNVQPPKERVAKEPKAPKAPAAPVAPAKKAPAKKATK